MGLIQELTRYLEVKGDVAVLTKENDELREKLNKVLAERDNFEYLYFLRSSSRPITSPINNIGLPDDIYVIYLHVKPTVVVLSTHNKAQHLDISSWKLFTGCGL